MKHLLQSITRLAGHRPVHRLRALAQPAARHIHPRLRLPLLIATLLVALALIVPASQKWLLAPFINRTIQITVLDADTGNPVSAATAITGSSIVSTNSNGVAVLHNQTVGSHRLSVKKALYADGMVSTFIWPFQPTIKLAVKLKATGRSLTATIVNKISGRPIAEAVIETGAVKSISSAQGKASLVLPTGSSGLSATVSAPGFHTTTIPLPVPTAQSINLELVPTGKVYFLDKQTGVLNVSKANLDGSQLEVAVKGTGREDDSGTQLLASPNQQYQVLLARRGNDNQYRLYLITTANDQLSIIDEGNNVGFSLIGWVGDRLWYQLERHKAIDGTYDQTALKTYDPSTRKLTTVDQTEAQTLDGSTFLMNAIQTWVTGKKLVYSKFWDRYGYYRPIESLGGKPNSIFIVNSDGSNRQTLLTYDATVYQWLYGIIDKPEHITFYLNGFTNAGERKPVPVYEFTKGQLKDTGKTSTEAALNLATLPFYPSPDGNHTLWHEVRNGKNTLILGDSQGNGPRELATMTEFTPLGWYNNEYVLYRFKNNEMYIAPADYSRPPNKVASFHNPQPNFGD